MSGRDMITHLPAGLQGPVYGAHDEALSQEEIA